MKRLLFVVCTTLSPEEFHCGCATRQFFADNDLQENLDFVVIYRNARSLAENYNRFLTGEYADAIVVFLHDDVQLGYHRRALGRLLHEAHQQFDIVGLAGATKLELCHPTVWHGMQRGASGGVACCHDGRWLYYVFGPTPARCECLDGFFLSVNVERLVAFRHRFDEQFTFHHYDIDFCLTANRLGLTVGTWPIWAAHFSPGLGSFGNPEWQASSERFCRKYGIGPLAG